MRPTGTAALRAATISSTRCILPGDLPVDQRRVDEARHDAVGADALAGILHGERHRRLVHGRLGGVIGEVRIAGPADRGQRRDVDDGAAALPQHVRNDGLRRAVDRAEIQFHRGLELLLGQLDRAAHMGHAHIVVQDVDAAETRDGLRNRRFDGGGIGDVRRDRDGLAAFLAMMAAVSSAVSCTRSTQATRAPSRA